MKVVRELGGGLVGAALVLAGCSAAPPLSPPPGSAIESSSTVVSGDVTPSATMPTNAASTTSPGTPAATTSTGSEPHPVSLQALMDVAYDGRDLRLGREGGSTNAYRQYYATYEGGGLTISGRINIPRGRGPFPAVVLAHGYVDPEEYTNGETMLRERDHLARQGYVTLHIDYRNHAQSDDDPDNDLNLRLGYTEDAINAALALQKHPAVDPDRIALIGRSMGGGVVYNALVVKPRLFRAAVAYSPVSSDSIDNFNHFIRRNVTRSDLVARVIAALGAPESEPERWADVSPRTFFDRITDPIMIHHGTQDESCPVAWSEETVAALHGAGKVVAYHVYEGERHTFTGQWPLSIRRTTDFLDRYLS